MRTIIIKM